MSQPVPPSDEWTLTRYIDPLVAEHGYKITDDYVELFWLPIIGPTSYLLMRQLARIHIPEAPKFLTTQPELLASKLGVGCRGGTHSPINKSMHRLDQFGCVKYHGPQGRDGLQHWTVFSHLPPLRRGMVERLHPALQAVHVAYTQERAA